MRNPDAQVDITFYQLEILLRLAYKEGKADQLSICEPDVGIGPLLGFDRTNVFKMRQELTVYKS